MSLRRVLGGARGATWNAWPSRWSTCPGAPRWPTPWSYAAPPTARWPPWSTNSARRSASSPSTTSWTRSSAARPAAASGCCSGRRSGGLPPGVWHVTGMTSLRRLARHFHVERPPSKSVTVAGIIQEVLERLPAAGRRVPLGTVPLPRHRRPAARTTAGGTDHGRGRGGAAMIGMRAAWDLLGLLLGACSAARRRAFIAPPGCAWCWMRWAAAPSPAACCS